MKATLTFSLDCKSTQHATALRDKTADWLNEDPDVQVFNQSMAPLSQRFRVVGVDTATKDPFADDVEASDEEEAKAIAVGRSKTRLVAEVRGQ